MKKTVKVLIVFIGILMILFSVACSKEKVTEGKTVKVHYTLEVDGQFIESTKGKEPLQFKTGTRSMIPGFEKAIIGMKVGEKKSFQVSPEEGYGEVNPEAFRSVPRKELPSNITPKAGMVLFRQAKNGRRVPVTIAEVKKNDVVMNFNHPLAGKTLHFDVEVMEIK